MSEKAINHPESKIEFIQNHKPSLSSGKYTITVKQIVKIEGKNNNNSDTFSDKICLAVLGERFALQPQDVYAFFPPTGSLGEWSTVLPHIALRRSTFPWERAVNKDRPNAPWLALLLFTETEHQGQKPDVLPPQLLQLEKLKKQTKGYTLKLKDLEATAAAMLPAELLAQLQQNSSIGQTYFPDFDLEPSQEITDVAMVLDVKKGLLQKVLPSLDDLEYLAHVRQAKNAQDKPDGEPLAVVIGNRLPQANVANTVYLVSLENRYSKESFDYQQAKDEDYIRLVVLTSWQFTCCEQNQSFQGLLTDLNGYKDKKGDVNQSYTLRLPKPPTNQPGAERAEEYLQKGYVPLRHGFRQGGNTISWYHGPLIPARNSTNPELATLSVSTADELVCYNPDNGMFDVSYAAAWELGRLLALQDSQFALNLLNWKRNPIRKAALDNQQDLYAHLSPSSQAEAANKEQQWSPDEWLRKLLLLQGVPFHYLVADERMLPSESIRFFWVDWFWLECLRRGAFSLGGDIPANGQQVVPQHQSITGFLLRSQVVSGWPDLQVEASGELLEETGLMSDEKKLKLLRLERLSDSVLLCLFSGEIKTVGISLKPQGLHFGLNTKENKFCPELRQLDGNKISDEKLEEIPWLDQERKALNINTLATKIRKQLESHSVKVENFTSAQFALQMIQSAESVRFC